MTDAKEGGTVQSTGRFAERRDANFYRLALLVLLTLLAVVGLHASSAQPAWDSHTKVHDAEVAGALEALVVVLFLVLVVRNRRPSVGPPLVARLRAALMYVLGGGIVALGIVLVDLLVNLHVPYTAPRVPRPPPPFGPVRPAFRKPARRTPRASPRARCSTVWSPPFCSPPSSCWR